MQVADRECVIHCYMLFHTLYILIVIRFQHLRVKRGTWISIPHLKTNHGGEKVSPNFHALSCSHHLISGAWNKFICTIFEGLLHFLKINIYYGYGLIE